MPETIPKCTSWRGHKFEPRYSTYPSDIDVERIAMAAAYLSYEAENNITQPRRMYECDVCIRCGAIAKPES